MIRTRWPGARIELARNSRAAALALEARLVDAVHPADEARWSQLYATAELRDEFRDWLAGFDLVISCWSDPDDDLRRRFPVHPDQKFISISPKPTLAPAAAHFCRPLSEA